jgi:hypothetical protein
MAPWDLPPSAAYGGQRDEQDGGSAQEQRLLLLENPFSREVEERGYEDQQEEADGLG